MAEQMNLGATLVFLTQKDGKQVLIRIDSVAYFIEEGEGSKVYFTGQQEPILVKESPIMIRRLITTSKKNEIKEIMGQIIEAQKDLMKGLTDILPPEFGGKDDEPFGDDSGD